MKPLSPRREKRPRPSYLSVNDCYFDSSDNSNNSNDSSNMQFSQMNGHASPSQTRLPKPQTFNFSSFKTQDDSKGHRGSKPPPGYSFCNGIPHSGQSKPAKNEVIPKFVRPRRSRRGNTNFVFAVHMVNIQRSMVNLQKTVAALEEKIQKSMQTSKSKQAGSPIKDYDTMLDRIQAIIREELRLIKDDVTSSKTQIKCNRELIKRVYVELNQRVTKDVSDLEGRVSKLEQREKHKREQRKTKANTDTRSGDNKAEARGLPSPK